MRLLLEYLRLYLSHHLRVLQVGACALPRGFEYEAASSINFSCTVSRLTLSPALRTSSFMSRPSATRRRAGCSKGSRGGICLASRHPRAAAFPPAIPGSASSTSCRGNSTGFCAYRPSRTWTRSFWRMPSRAHAPCWHALRYADCRDCRRRYQSSWRTLRRAARAIVLLPCDFHVESGLFCRRAWHCV